MAEEELNVVNDFCNVHGDPVQVLESSSGEFFVNLKDIVRTGFKIYKGDTFIPSMVDRKQIIKEFEMYMLTAAHNFLLTHQKKDIDELKVLQTIENCKKKLLGNNLDAKESAGSSGSHQTSNNSVRRQPRENQFHNKNGNFTPEKCLQKTDEDFRRKEYKNSQENMQPSNIIPNTFSSSGSVDSQESILIRMLAGENLPYVDLEIGKVCKMNVCYVVPHKQNICWAHKLSAIPSLEELMINIFKAEPELEVLSNPQEGQLVLGLFEGAWYRGKVTSLNPTVVHYLDYGNRTKTPVVKRLPESFKKLPAFAFRLKLSTFPKGKLEDGLTLTVMTKWKYEDRTHVVEVIDGEDDHVDANHFVTSQEKYCKEKDEDEFCNEDAKKRGFFGLPEPLINLKDGAEVRLVDMDDGIIFVKTKECYDKTKEITSYINVLDTTTVSAVKTNQLVLSTRDNVPGLYRAIVTNIVSNVVVTIKYLDHPGTDNVSVKSLKNVDEYLSKQPVNLLQLPVLDEIKNLGMEAVNLLDGLIKRKDKVTVVNRNGKFDLKLSTGQLLSDALGSC